MRLGESTLSDDERRTEASKMLADLPDHLEEMMPHERKFVENMSEQAEHTPQRYSVSPNQLFWLRDLYQKYCI